MTVEQIFFTSWWAVMALFVLSALNGSMYYTYVWQLKEYRLDRMIDTLSTKSGFKKVVPVFKMVHIVLLVCGALNFAYFGQIEVFVFFALLALLLELIDLLFRVRERKLYRPTFTLKAKLIVAATFVSTIVFGAGSYIISRMLAETQFELFAIHSLILLLLATIIPDINTLFVALFHPITLKMKQKIIDQAKAKIASRDNLTIIGITGSYGKSSTKEFLYALLASKYEGKVFKTPGNTNVDIGVAKEIIAHLKDEHEYAVIEMGAYKKGEIRAITQIVPPDIAIVTAVEDQHLSLFGSLKNIQDAKYELVQGLKEDGIAFFNADSKGAKELYSRAKEDSIKAQTYAVETTAHINALYAKADVDHVEFKIHETLFEAPLFGKQNIPNLLAALITARVLKMSHKEIAQAMKQITPPPKLMNVSKVTRDSREIFVINDSYNANPDGVVAALHYLNLYERYRKIFVFPGMLELGPKSDMEHIRVAKKAAEICDVIILTSSDFEGPFKLELSDEEKEKCVVVTDTEKLIKKLDQETQGERSVILFESRVQEEVLKHFS